MAVGMGLVSACTGPPVDGACRYGSSARVDWDAPVFGVTAAEVVDVLVEHGDVAVELIGGPVQTDQFTWTFERVGRPREVELVQRRGLGLGVTCREGPALDIEVETSFSSASGLFLPPHAMMVRVYDDGSIQISEERPDEAAIPASWSDVVARQLADDPGYEARGLYVYVGRALQPSLEALPAVFDGGEVNLVAENPQAVQSSWPARWSRIP
jgi:hypothetical protein